MYPYRGRGRGRVYYKTPKPNPREVAGVETTTSFNHDNNCCKNIDLVLDLDVIASSFLSELKNMWNLLKNSPPVVNLLHQYLNKSANPYEDVLRLVYNCHDFYNAKTKSLPLFIAEEFRNFLKTNRNETVHLLTPQLKINVFKTISQQNSQNLTKLFVDIYEMPQDGSIFLKTIQCFIEKKKYKEACQYSVWFNLQNKFKIDDFLLPLILQDRLFNIDEFLHSSPKHQTELVIFLDSVLGKGSIRDTLAIHASNLNVPDVKIEKLYAKPLKKLITRLVKTFKIPENLTPNLSRRRNEGALQFLIHKRYTENTFGEASWREMVEEAIGTDQELQKELVAQVYLHGDHQEALRWAKFYNIDKRHWPCDLDVMQNDTVQENTQTDDSWGDDVVFNQPNPQPTNNGPVEYHRFPLSMDDIVLIDDGGKFRKFVENSLKNVNIVGIDCEWKPNFGSHKNELALMQIATRRNVYILDIVNLGRELSYLWQELGTNLFHNGNILKLGFGFSADVAMIKQTLPELNLGQKQVGFLDLLSLWKHFERYLKISLPYDIPSTGPSFSTLVNQCFGRPLDKSDQFSNWEKRPLRESQLIYASLDAYCLIQVYDVMKMCCDKANLAFDEISMHLMTNEKLPKKKPKKTAAKKRNLNPIEDIVQPTSPNNLQTMSVCSLKLVCDTMLQGLGKNLRRCGINTVILENNMDHMECVRYAQDEKRFILTKGAIFNKLYGYVPMGHCLKIQSDNVDEQLKEVIDYYNVNVTKDDVFSVCQSCNGHSFVKISYSKMLLMKKLLDKPERYSEYNMNDEATGFSSDEDADCDNFLPDAPTIQSNCHLNNSELESVDFESCKTKTGAYIQIEAIPSDIFNKVELFYVCEDCGKVYWDGSHLERVLQGRLHGIVQ